jgi:hypothetical protein
MTKGIFSEDSRPLMGMTEEDKDFQVWMRNLDKKIQDVFGLPAQDVVGYNYRNMYDAGLSTDEAASHVFTEEGADFRER